MSAIPAFTYERVKLLSGFDGKECKVYPRLIKAENNIFISYSMLLLSGIDVFNDIYFVKSTDGGVSFGAPELLQRLETRENGIRKIFSPNDEYYSDRHKKWFSFGCNLFYEDDTKPVLVGGVSVSSASYILRDPETGHYVGDLRPLPLPFECISAVPHGQVFEYENGDLQLSFYLRPKGVIKPLAMTVRYRYENDALSIVEAGKVVDYPLAARGLSEPSVAKLGEKYYMTLRTDEQGLLATSDDGFAFAEPTPWKWDDGSVLQNYNTMQRWIRHKDRLFLAYTRRGANNDHVFRHRAPIFMAAFDPENQCLVKSSEVILVPELGARLGNFTVAEISDKEFWLLTAEWMQPAGCEKYGSDNSIWIAKVRFA